MCLLISESPLSISRPTHLRSFPDQQQHQHHHQHHHHYRYKMPAEPPQMDVLEFLQRRPERPPAYKDVNTSPKVSFPVFEQQETYVLPTYTPAVYSTTLVLRKLEFLSPYEPAPVRSWRNLVMEINSTQLNFYAVDNIPMLNHVKKSKTKKHYEFTPVEHELLCEAIARDTAKYLTPAKLVRSYSLQHARFGIPVDYKKRTSCLRLRCETEQFLVQFISIDEMISWANDLSMGMNVSLDLDSRELPTDRIVPRRRRSRRRNRAFSDSELIRRELAEPRSQRRASFSAGTESGIKSKISRIFGRKNTSSSSSSSSSNQVSMEEIRGSLSINSTTSPSEEQGDTDTSMGDIPEAEELAEEAFDIDSVHQLHDSDDDTDSLTDLFNSFSLNQAHDPQTHTTSSSMSSALSSSWEKWKPEPKSYSRRKFLKDSIRCIKLLQTKDSWVGKTCVIACPPPKFQTCNKVDKVGLNKHVIQYVVGAHGFV